MKYKNYIWDFDGTLFDSYPHLLSCLLQILKEENILDRFDTEDVNRHLLVSFNDVKSYTAVSDYAFGRFTELELRMGDDEVSPKIVPFPDAGYVLEAIVRNGGRNFMYTHRNETSTRYLKQFGLDRFFTDSVTSEEHFPSKPSPDAILALISRNSLNPAECIMIGDREIDGLSGRNAGIASALVNYPPHLPDGTCPADVTKLDYSAAGLTKFAEIMGII